MTHLPRYTSEVGIQLIAEFEGLKLERYKDAAGLWTIGYGHLILPQEINSLCKITPEEARTLLRNDLARTEKGVNGMVTCEIGQNQFDALVSFAFNVGIGNLKKSTLLRKLNEGDINSAALQFLVWNKAGGKVLAGLTRRREAEMKLFLA